MSTSPDGPTYRKYTFQDCTGYVVAPWIPGVDHRWVTVRHSAGEPPWQDRDVHLHRASEEYYFLFQGELHLLVAGAALRLRPGEVLMVRPGVPHAVVGGRGPIEHFVLRFPAAEDRVTVGPLPSGFNSEAGEIRREVRDGWGCRVPLGEAAYQNCWLFGVGRARFPSEQMCLAYLYFPGDEDVRVDDHRHRLHLHRESWEVYVVLRGTRVLRVEEELVEVREGEILEVAPGARHVLHATRTPFVGLTFRVPLRDDKVEF